MGILSRSDQMRESGLFREYTPRALQKFLIREGYMHRFEEGGKKAVNEFLVRAVHKWMEEQYGHAVDVGTKEMFPWHTSGMTP